MLLLSRFRKIKNDLGIYNTKQSNYSDVCDRLVIESIRWK